MTKQEFMAMSLPYGLKCLELQHRGDKKGEIGTFTGYELDMFSIISELRMPILRPLSYLVKPCLEGKLIPIVELAKIYEEIHGEIKTKQVKDISACLYINSDEEEMVLAYHWKTQSFGANTYLEKVFINVHQQLPMFQKLVEWHFDIAGLIEKGEAIDVNTLEENPYK